MFIQNDFADVNKIEASECNSVSVLGGGHAPRPPWPKKFPLFSYEQFQALHVSS